LRFIAPPYERAGDLDRTKDLFTNLGVNVSYRGVNEELKALEIAYGLRPFTGGHPRYKNTSIHDSFLRAKT
jgi:hypothetical protein